MPNPIILAEYEKWSEQKKVTAQERKKAGKSLGKEDKIVLEELKNRLIKTIKDFQEDVNTVLKFWEFKNNDGFG